MHWSITCKLGICLPRGALTAISKTLSKSGLDLDKLAGLRLNLSGCPNTCGAHMIADLGFYGKVARKGQTPFPSYGVVAGAKLGHGIARLAEPVGDINARDLPLFVTDYFAHYIENQSRYANYAEYYHSAGKQHLQTLCEKHSNIPDFDEDKNYYYDWGADELFTLAGRGQAECSAGLFDLIEVDLRNIKSGARIWNRQPMTRVG